MIALPTDHALKLKETHSFKQVEEIVGISMSMLKREASKRKAQDTHNLFQ